MAKEILKDEDRIKFTLDDCGCTVFVARGESNGVKSFRWQDVEVDDWEFCDEHGEEPEEIGDLVDAVLEAADGAHDSACSRDEFCRCVKDAALDLYATLEPASRKRRTRKSLKIKSPEQLIEWLLAIPGLSVAEGCESEFRSAVERMFPKEKNDKRREDKAVG